MLSESPMMKKEMCTESVSPDKQRLLKYKVLASAFSYPEGDFFDCFPQLEQEREKVVSEYDLLFRARGIWLYTTEYTAKGEFQKAQCLSDIMAFYRAFGVQPEKDRPDSLSAELEFMHYLIFKSLYALEKDLKDSQEKISLCLRTQRDFFAEHLHPGAKAIAEKIASQKEGSFYKEMAGEVLAFLGEEERFFANLPE